jgi:hypothetical protein
MTTIIDNNQTVFQIVSQGWSAKQFFCNLADVPAVLTQEFEPNEDYIIYRTWNFRMKKQNRKTMNELFKANQINHTI